MPNRGCWPRLTLIASALLAVGTLERPADACSIAAPDAALVGYPADGETGIPTDVSPYYRLNYEHFAISSVEFELTSSSGTAVNLTVESDTFAAASAVNLIAADALEPETVYTLQASTTAGPFDVVTFTTGAGRSEPPPIPPAALTHYQFVDPPPSTCSPWPAGTCVSLPGELLVESTMIDDVGQEHPYYIGRGPFFANLSGIDQGTPFTCIKLRTRAANGTFGEPGVFCGADAPLFDLTGSDIIRCSPEGLLHDGSLVQADETAPQTKASSTSSAGGCAMATRTASNGHALVALCAALLALARSRAARAQRKSR